LPRVRTVVIKRHALAGQQEGAIELGVEQRSGTKLLSLGGRRRVARVAALLERDDARDHCHNEQRGDVRPERPAAAAANARSRIGFSAKERPLGSRLRSASWSADQSRVAASRAPR